MQLAAFAFDYDGTLAHDGRVDDSTLAALRRLKASGLRLLLVTGRQYPDLQRACPQYALFDALVVENGALLVLPAQQEERSLAAAPPTTLLEALKRQQIAPLSIGRSIIATWEPHEQQVLQAIRDSGAEWQITFNKGAVMCLPAGINKASGLAAALEALELSALNVFGVGDAQNDQALLAACGYSAAVANATDLIKAQADIVTLKDHGAGVVELIERFLADPKCGLTRAVRRHDVLLGRDPEGAAIALPPASTVLIAGGSGSGKSRLSTLLIERIVEHGFQLCIVDPEGEYEHLPRVSAFGNPKSVPSLEEAAHALQQPDNSVVLNLLAVELESRPRIVAGIVTLIESLQSRNARPHWLVIDEAHHGLPPGSQTALLQTPRIPPGTILVTAAPASIAHSALDAAQFVITLGANAAETLEHYCAATHSALPLLRQRSLALDEALYFDRAAAAACIVKLDAPRQQHQRHLRKYAQGTLGEDKSFYFRGPKDLLKLRAHNLSTFLQLAAGVDDETWLFHLQRGDYSRWFREAIKDEALAEEARRLEGEQPATAATSRKSMRELVTGRYTAAADVNAPQSKL